MKLILALASILFVQSALAQNLNLPKTCEDVLPVDTCTKLRAVAATFNEKVGTVNQAVIDAYNHHKTKAAETLSFVKEYLVDKATNFQCSDALTAEVCEQLKSYAKAAHLQLKEVNRAVREAIANGASNAVDMFNKAQQFLTSEITCEKVLGEDQCNALKAAASKLHENVQIVNDAIKEAVQRHLSNAADLLQYVKDVIVDKATNFKCSDVLDQENCDKIAAAAQQFKLKTSEINLAVKEAIVNGAAQAKDIYARAMGWLLNDAKNLQCKDLIDADICDQVVEYAKKFHMSVKDATRAVKEAIVEGAGTAKEYLTKAKKYLNSQLSCDQVLGKASCEKIQALAEKFGIHLETVNAFMKEAFANGITNVKELYADAVKFILKHWTGIFGDEPDMYKRSIENEEVQARVMEAVEKFLDVMLE